MTSHRAWKTTPRMQPYLDYAYRGPAIPGSSLPRASHTWIKPFRQFPYIFLPFPPSPLFPPAARDAREGRLHWKSQKSDFWGGFPRRERRMTSHRAWKTTPRMQPYLDYAYRGPAIPGSSLPRASHTWIQPSAGQPYLDPAFRGPAIPGSSLPRANHTWIQPSAGQPYLDPAISSHFPQYSPHSPCSPLLGGAREGSLQWLIFLLRGGP